MVKRVTWVLIAIVIAFMLSGGLAQLGIYLVAPVIVTGNSMLPTLHDGQIVMVIRTGLIPIKRGDIVVLQHSDGEYLIKRVVGIPGDTICVQQNVVYVNEPCSPTGTTTILDNNLYYVLGDNMEHSVDSRVFGPIEYKNIAGVVITP